MPNGHGLNAFHDIRPEVVKVKAFNRTWTLAGWSAFDWLGAAALDLDHLTGIFPGLVDDSHLDELWAFSALGDFAKRSELVARAALGRAAGKDWWWVLNLSRKILTGWPAVNGTMIREGVRAHDTSFPDYLDAFYSLIWVRGKDEDRMRLDLELSMPPPGVRVKQSAAAKKAMLDQFAAE